MKKEEFIAKYGVEAYERRLAKQRKRGKMYRQTHKEELSEYFKQRYKIHKEEIAEYFRQYYKIHKEEIAEKNKRYHKEYNNTPMGRARNLLKSYNYKDRIMNRGEGDLTPEWIVENIFNVGKCHYCGMELPFTELGCDRKDSSLPHTKDNCVPCCESCNKKKQAKSYDEYKNALVN